MPTDTEELDLRGQLEAAFEEEENNDEDTGDIEDSGDLGGDSGLSSESQEDLEESEESEGGETGQPEESAEGGAPESTAQVEADEIKPPVGYSPEAMEAWKDVPQKVKEQIKAREVHMAQAMQNTKMARNTHDQITQLANSFAPIIAAEGAKDPIQAVQGLFQTVAELRMGTPQQRAQKMASLIDHYGIDISMLDSALAGTAPAESSMGQANPDMIQQAVQQAIAPLYQERQQQVQSQVNNELADFAKTAEFLPHVREQMATMIETAAHHGKAMSFKEAYDACCAMNPEIQNVMAQRRQQEEIQKAAGVTAAKRNASSSLGARSVPGNGAAAPMDLRGQLEQAWDDAQGA